LYGTFQVEDSSPLDNSSPDVLGRFFLPSVRPPNDEYTTMGKKGAKDTEEEKRTRKFHLRL
jgi:hypothetical protein